MKNLLSFLFLLLLTGSLLAQAPQALNYQGVARNQSGTPIANQSLQIRLSVLSGSATGTTVYRERHTVQTNALGLYNLLIGSGTVLNGNFQLISWASSSHYLKVEMDPTGGSNFVQLGTPSLLASVPYALEATHALQTELEGDVTGSSTFVTVQGLQNRPISTDAPSNGQVLKWDGTEWTPSTDATSGGNSLVAGPGINISNNVITNTGDLDPDNELQTLSITGNQLKISQGNTVTLPSGGGGGSSFWTSAGGADIQNTNNGTVFIGSGSIPYQAIFASANNGSATIVTQQGGSGTALEAANYSGGNSAQFTGRVTIDGNNSQYALLVENGEAGFPDGMNIGQSNRFEYDGINQLTASCTISPTADAYFDLGRSFKRWNTVYAANGTINTSDATMKRDILPINYGIDKVMQLNPVSFEWKDGRPGEGRHIGFLAQELQKVVPEVVYDKEWVYEKEDRSDAHWRPAAKLGVAYSEMIPVLSKAIQEQQVMILQLQQQNTALMARIEALEKQ